MISIVGDVCALAGSISWMTASRSATFAGVTSDTLYGGKDNADAIRWRAIDTGVSPGTMPIQHGGAQSVRCQRANRSGCAGPRLINTPPPTTNNSASHNTKITRSDLYIIARY